MKKPENLKILLAGGGSGGSVSPLLAVAKTLKTVETHVEFLFVGGRKGPEKQMAENAELEFVAVSSGKFRRYFSLKNFFTPFLILAGLIASFRILWQFKPAVVFGAGSFVQVPVIWAAWILRIPCVIHQQDLVPSLANRLCEPFVKNITVCFEKSITDFSSGLGLFYTKKTSDKVVLTGNPFREELLGKEKNKALKAFGLKGDLPVLLVLGGGTGSDFLNRLIEKALPELARSVQILHSWGTRSPKSLEQKNYKGLPFISDMASAYAAADLVVSRAGLSTLSELSALGKVSIIIPMPHTHQEYNAALLSALNAALVFDQTELNEQVFVRIIRKVLFDYPLQQTLAKNISKIMLKNSAEKISKIILKAAHRT